MEDFKSSIEIKGHDVLNGLREISQKSKEMISQPPPSWIQKAVYRYFFHFYSSFFFFFYVNFFVLKKWELFFLLFFLFFFQKIYRGRHQVCIKPKKKTLQTSTPSRSAANRKKGKNNFRKSRIVVEEDFNGLDEMSMVSDKTVYNRRWNTQQNFTVFFQFSDILNVFCY